MFSDNLLKEFLDEKVAQYQRPEFIINDPLQIPHRFEKKEDIEIAGFFAAILAWGNRKSIIQNAEKILQRMGNSPFDFIMNSKSFNLTKGIEFKHRTFNETDLQYFFTSLQNIYLNHGGLESVFRIQAQDHSLQQGISYFKSVFFELPHQKRTEKHIADPMTGSAAKRLNMMLRWFVRKDVPGVDLGIWNGSFHPKQLSCPLDIHTGNVARQLGLLKRTQNDSKSVAELDQSLRSMDANDPVKYDFALFGIGVNNDLK